MEKTKNKFIILLSIMTFTLILIFTILSLSVLDKILYTDSLIHYTFAHAIRIGEIPYNDFNIITPPLYTFITSIGLFIYDDYIVFLVENLFIITIILLLIYKLLKQSIIYYLPILLLLGVLLYSLFPTYNLLCILLIILLVLFEKEKKNDLLIGLIIGLIILSKHTIGACIFIVGILLVIKNRKRLISRLIGVFIPLLVFLIYLLVTKSLFNFIDLSILGLFSFSNNNGNYLNVLSIISCILIIISIILLIKYKDKKYDKTALYYSIPSISLAIPIFDPYHTGMFFTLYFLFIILFLKDNKIIKINKKYIKHLNIIHYSVYIMIFFTISTHMYSYFSDYLSSGIYKPKANHLKRFNIVDKKMYNEYIELKDKYTYYDKKSNAIFLGSWSNLMNIVTDKKITYFDVMLYGNFGYNIEKRTNKLLNELDDTYIFIERNHTKKSTNKYSQYYYPIYKKIKDNYELVDSTKKHDIYYKK